LPYSPFLERGAKLRRARHGGVTEAPVVNRRRITAYGPSGKSSTHVATMSYGLSRLPDVSASRCVKAGRGVGVENARSVAGVR
jgi:hypothetical protein